MKKTEEKTDLYLEITDHPEDQPEENQTPPDSLSLLSKEIQNFPVLTEAQEQAFCQSIKDARKQQKQLCEEIKKLRFKKSFRQNGLTDIFEQIENEIAPKKLKDFKPKIFQAVFNKDKKELKWHWLELIRQKEQERQWIWKMALHNLRLVVKYANAFRIRSSGSNMALEDLIGYGILGLFNAPARYNSKYYLKNNKTPAGKKPRDHSAFATYGSWWIIQALTRALDNNSRVIRFPVHIVEKLKKFNKTEKLIRKRKEYEPTSEEIAQMANMSLEMINKIKNLANLNPLSLDSPASFDDEENVLGAFLPDAKSLSQEEILSAKTLKKSARDVLKTLTPKEEKIIRLRFGIDCGKYGLANCEHTLEEIGMRLDLTRERIRQIEEKAFNKLRRICRIKNLQQFLSKDLY